MIGAGELVRAKLRLLLAAGGTDLLVRATDGDHDASGLDAFDAPGIEQRKAIR